MVKIGETAEERVRKFADEYHRRYGERFVVIAMVGSPEYGTLVLYRSDLDKLLGIDRTPKKPRVVRIKRRK